MTRKKIPTMARTGPRAPKTYGVPEVDVMCMHCAGPSTSHPDGRPRLYCSDRCRVAAWRARSKGGAS